MPKLLSSIREIPAILLKDKDGQEQSMVLCLDVS